MDYQDKENLMFATILLWGAVAGVVHFVLIGMLYGNPVVGRMYGAAATESPAMKHWTSKPKYMVTQFLGTQVEVYLLTIAFLWLRPLVAVPAYSGALLIGALLAAIRVYPRYWNMWIQTTYPNRLLATEAINGSIGTLAIALFLQAVTQP
ncbi:MAG: hypothetical protein HY903_12235 [Deltaproteobacteria bacterium]|nr:hypothetical protein [Deltaproteobacteria bacterium]